MKNDEQQRTEYKEQERTRIWKAAGLIRERQQVRMADWKSTERQA